MTDGGGGAGARKRKRMQDPSGRTTLCIRSATKNLITGLYMKAL